MDAEKISKGKTQNPQTSRDGRDRLCGFSLRAEIAGKVWEGEFVNRACDNNMRLKIAAVSAQYREGMPREAFTQEQLFFQDTLAHLTVSLVERPDWAQNLGTLEEDQVIYAIYAEVAKHEVAFRGRHTNPA